MEWETRTLSIAKWCIALLAGNIAFLMAILLRLKDCG